MRLFGRLLAGLRQWWNRRSARKLLAQQLPRGVKRTLLLLPAPPRRLDLSTVLQLPALPPPLPDLGVARPRHLRLDESFRVPGEIDLPAPPRPPPPRRVRPRTPLARAPLHRLAPRNFRLDPGGAPANEQILALDRSREVSWLLPAFRRRYVDLPWMARERVAFLGPLSAEWFVLWWDQTGAATMGPGEPDSWTRPNEVDEALDHCKEQMLIRRDVGKDENAPPEQRFTAPKLTPAMAPRAATSLRKLIPEKQWVAVAKPQELAPGPPSERAPREAYLEWRTLMDALGER